MEPCSWGIGTISSSYACDNDSLHDGHNRMDAQGFTIKVLDVACPTFCTITVQIWHCYNLKLSSSCYTKGVHGRSLHDFFRWHWRWGMSHLVSRILINVGLVQFVSQLLLVMIPSEMTADCMNIPRSRNSSLEGHIPPRASNHNWACAAF